MAGIPPSAWVLRCPTPWVLLLRDLRRLGGWEGASEGGIKMAGVETGEASLVGRRDAGGAGSTTEFRRLS